VSVDSLRTVSSHSVLFVCSAERAPDKADRAVQASY